MPEGHTLRKLADDLTAAFAGRRVRVTSPQGRFAADAEQVDGSRLVCVDSAGKHLFVEVEGERYIHVHLGLIGQFDVHDGVEALDVRGHEIADVTDPSLVARDDRSEVAPVVPTGIKAHHVVPSCLENRNEDLADVATVAGHENSHVMCHPPRRVPMVAGRMAP